MKTEDTLITDLICINTAKNAYGIRRLEQEAKKRNLNFRNVNINEILQVFKEDELLDNFSSLNFETTAVIPRNCFKKNVYDSFLFLEILERFHKAGAKVLNYSSFKEYPFIHDKLNQTFFFSNNDFQYITPTFFVRDSNNLDSIIKNIPIIVKPRISSHGSGIVLIEDKSQLIEFSKTVNLSEFIFQKFIPNTYDLRVITTQNRILGVMKRSRTSGLVNNYSAGSTIASYSFKDSFWINECKRLCKVLNASYVGIDLIFDNDDNDFKILEINRFCEYKGLEKVTNINFAEFLIKSTLNSK